MFVAAGSRAEGFCRWVGRLGEKAAVLDETLPDDLILLHLEARALLGTSLRKTLETAREQGALISIDLVARAGAVYRVAKTRPTPAPMRDDLLTT